MNRPGVSNAGPDFAEYTRRTSLLGDRCRGARHAHRMPGPDRSLQTPSGVRESTGIAGRHI